MYVYTHKENTQVKKYLNYKSNSQAGEREGKDERSLIMNYHDYHFFLQIK